MKKTIFSALFIAVYCSALWAQKLPSDKKILQTLHRTNAYFIQKWPDAGKSIFTNIERPSNIWTRAVYYEGLVALYKQD